MSPKEQTTARNNAKYNLNLLYCDLTKLPGSDFFVLLIFIEIIFSIFGGKADAFCKDFRPSPQCKAFLEP